MTNLLAAALLTAIAAFAPIDRFVTVNGLALHIRCSGDRTAGSALVVLEAGANQAIKTWDNVFGPIAQFARVCAYERPGIGQSAASADEPSIGASVETLHALLEAAAEPPPYVMVGHSWGGALVQLFARRHASEVTGLVLIDATHEQQEQRFAALVDGRNESAAHSGPFSGEPLDTVGLERELSAPWHSDIPLIVLAHSPSTDPVDDPRVGALLQELGRDLSTRSSRGEFIVAQKGVGHFIQNQQPALVIESIRRIVDK